MKTLFVRKVTLALLSLLVSWISLPLAHADTGCWTSTGLISPERQRHTATLLPNGEVLIAGGANSGPPTSSAMLFDPATEDWTSTGSMSGARQYHTATLLPNGKLLVAGGDRGGSLSSAELYDPATGDWTNTSSMSNVRYYHTATLLPNGTVLVTGGAAPAASVFPARYFMTQLPGLGLAQPR